LIGLATKNFFHIKKLPKNSKHLDLLHLLQNSLFRFLKIIRKNRRQIGFISVILITSKAWLAIKKTRFYYRRRVWVYLQIIYKFYKLFTIFLQFFNFFLQFFTIFYNFYFSQVFKSFSQYLVSSLLSQIPSFCNTQQSYNNKSDNPNQEYKFLIYVRDDVINDKNDAGEMCSWRMCNYLVL